MIRHHTKAFSITIAFILSLALSVSAGAASQLTCWVSNEDSVCYTPYDGSYYIYQLSSDSSFQTKFTAGLNTASSQWNEVLPISIGSKSESYALNYVYGGSYDQLVSRFPSLVFGNGGLTITSATTVDTLTYNGSRKTIGELKVGGRMCIVEYNISGNTLSTNVYRCIATHEMGHLFGWKGHSPSPDDVLYESASESYTLTSNDKAHLKQIYDIYY